MNQASQDRVVQKAFLTCFTRIPQQLWKNQSELSAACFNMYNNNVRYFIKGMKDANEQAQPNVFVEED